MTREIVKNKPGSRCAGADCKATAVESLREAPYTEPGDKKGPRQYTFAFCRPCADWYADRGYERLGAAKPGQLEMAA